MYKPSGTRAVMEIESGAAEAVAEKPRDAHVGAFNS
jgi:hypothetical protein